MSETTKETTPPDTTPTPTTPPIDTEATSTGPETHVVKTPDSNPAERREEEPPERGPSSLAVASSTGAAVTVLGVSALVTAAGPVTAAVVVGGGAVAAGAAVVRRRRRRAAASRASGLGSGRGRGRGRSRGIGRGRSTRVPGVGRSGRAGKGLGGRLGRSTARTAGKKAASRARGLGATPKRGRPVGAGPKARPLGKSLARAGRTSRKPAGRSLLGGGKGSGKGPGKGRGKGLTWPKLGRGRSSTTGKGGGKPGKGGGKKKPQTPRQAAKEARRRNGLLWRQRLARRVAGAGRWGGGRLRRFGWWLWGPKLELEREPTPEQPDFDLPDEPGGDGGKRKKKKKKRRVDPNGTNPDTIPDTSGPSSGSGTSGGSPVSGSGKYLVTAMEALDADLRSMRNEFADFHGGSWTDTKKAMRAVQELYELLGQHFVGFANDTQEKGGYVGAFAEQLALLGGSSNNIGEQFRDTLNLIRGSQGELVDYAESDQAGRFDRTRNTD